MVAKIEVLHPKVITKSGSESRKILNKGKNTFELRDPAPDNEKAPGECSVILIHPDGRSTTEIQTYPNATRITHSFDAEGEIYPGGEDTLILGISHEEGPSPDQTREIPNASGLIVLARVTHLNK